MMRCDKHHSSRRYLIKHMMECIKPMMQRGIKRHRVRTQNTITTIKSISIITMIRKAQLISIRTEDNLKKNSAISVITTTNAKKKNTTDRVPNSNGSPMSTMIANISVMSKNSTNNKKITTNTSNKTNVHTKNFV